jgi:hypothetical protein
VGAEADIRSVLPWAGLASRGTHAPRPPGWPAPARPGLPARLTGPGDEERPVPKVAGRRAAEPEAWGATRGAEGAARPGGHRRAGVEGTRAAAGRAHSPSRAFFFFASVPPSLPRNDSSFFILGALGVGERGAEDMGRARAAVRRHRPLAGEWP